MIKILLGAFTAILCLILQVKDIISAIGICLLVYFGADRVLRQVFIEKVEKLSVVTKTGIGIYIVTWLFVWVLLYTLTVPSATESLVLGRLNLSFTLNCF